MSGGYVNPLLTLPAAQKILALKGPFLPRAYVVELLQELRDEADAEAENSWRRRKGPMAAYWRACCTYVLHTARAIKRAGKGALLGMSALRQVCEWARAWVENESGIPETPSARLTQDERDGLALLRELLGPSAFDPRPIDIGACRVLRVTVKSEGRIVYDQAVDA